MRRTFPLVLATRRCFTKTETRSAAMCFIFSDLSYLASAKSPTPFYILRLKRAGSPAFVPYEITENPLSSRRLLWRARPSKSVIFIRPLNPERENNGDVCGEESLTVHSLDCTNSLFNDCRRIIKRKIAFFANFLTSKRCQGRWPPSPT